MSTTHPCPGGCGAPVPAHLFACCGTGCRATRDAAAMRRYGKKHAGRELDGRVWGQFLDSRAGVEEAET